MYFESKLCLRFLKSEGSTPLKVFFKISLSCVFLSVVLLLLIDALIRGVGFEFTRRVMGVYPVISVQGDAEALQKSEPYLKKSLAPFINNPSFKKIENHHLAEWVKGQHVEGLLQTSQKVSAGVSVEFVTKSTYDNVFERFKVVDLRAESEDNSSSSIHVLVGKRLAENLRLWDLSLNDNITLVIPIADIRPDGGFEPRRVVLTLDGVFDSGDPQWDEHGIYVQRQPEEIGLAQGFYQSDWRLYASEFLSLPQAEREVFKANIQSEGLTVVDFETRFGNIMRAMQLEQKIYVFVLILVLIIALVNFSGVIFVVMSEKRHEQSLLMALGMSIQRVRLVFILMITGMVGMATLLGCLLTGLTLLLMREFDMSLPTIYGFSQIPLHMSPVTFIVVLIGVPALAMILCLSYLRQIKYEFALKELRS